MCKLYLDCSSHLQTRLPEANCWKMNKGKQFLIQKDESSDSEEPAEGWKANNHGTPPPHSLSFLLFLSYQSPATEYTVVGYSITPACLSSLSCHVLLLHLRLPTDTTAEPPCVDRPKISVESWICRKKERGFFRNLAQVNRMKQDGGKMIWNKKMLKAWIVLHNSLLADKMRPSCKLKPNYSKQGCDNTLLCIWRPPKDANKTAILKRIVWVISNEYKEAFYKKCILFENRAFWIHLVTSSCWMRTVFGSLQRAARNVRAGLIIT